MSKLTMMGTTETDRYEPKLPFFEQLCRADDWRIGAPVLVDGGLPRRLPIALPVLEVRHRILHWRQGRRGVVLERPDHFGHGSGEMAGLSLSCGFRSRVRASLYVGTILHMPLFLRMSMRSSLGPRQQTGLTSGGSD